MPFVIRTINMLLFTGRLPMTILLTYSELSPMESIAEILWKLAYLYMFA